MTSRTTGILVGASLLAFTLLTSCAEPTTNEIIVSSGGYKINIPKHMIESKELNEEASLQYADTTQELYIIVIDEPKTDFIKAYSDPDLDSSLSKYDDKLTPEKNYRIVQMESMAAKMTLRGEPKVKKQTINGLDAEVVDFVGKVEGVYEDIYYKLAFVEGTKNIYMVMTWTLASDKGKNNKEMDQMIQSFRLSE